MIQSLGFRSLAPSPDPGPHSGWLFLNVFGSETDQGIEIFSVTGLGSPKANVTGRGGPNRDGIIVNSVQTDARHIVITLVIRAGEDEETKKAQILDTFRVRAECILRVDTDSKTVDIYGYVESVEANQFAKMENYVISILCPTPWFQSIVEQNLTILNTGTLINNAGDITRGCTMTFTINGSGVSGPFSIKNDWWGVPEEEVMTWNVPTSMPGYPLITGDTMVLNTNRGEKSLWHWRGSTGFNLISYLDLDDVGWLRLHLNDTNDFTYTAGSGVANMSCKVKFRHLYSGV